MRTKHTIPLAQLRRRNEGDAKRLLHMREFQNFPPIESGNPSTYHSCTLPGSPNTPLLRDLDLRCPPGSLRNGKSAGASKDLLPASALAVRVSDHGRRSSSMKQLSTDNTVYSVGSPSPKHLRSQCVMSFVLEIELPKAMVSWKPRCSANLSRKLGHRRCLRLAWLLVCYAL